LLLQQELDDLVADKHKIKADYDELLMKIQKIKNDIG
jgi:hypothetical protein